VFGLAAGENANASQIPAGTAYLFATGGRREKQIKPDGAKLQTGSRSET
jgi:hypothetical protein